MVEFEVHDVPIMRQVSFRVKGSGLNQRKALATIYQQGDVGILFGVQGAGFFEAVAQNVGEVFGSCSVLMGYIPKEHVDRYRTIPLAVTERWEKMPFPGGPVMVWVEARRI